MTGRERGKTSRRGRRKMEEWVRGEGVRRRRVRRRRKDEGQGCGGGKWFILQPR